MAKKDFSVIGVAVLVLSLFLLVGAITLIVLESSSGDYLAEGAEDLKAEKRYETIAKLKEEDAKELEGLDDAMSKAVDALKTKTVKPVPMAAPPIPTNIIPPYKKEGGI